MFEIAATTSTALYGATFNESGSDSDFRIESENENNMLRIDAAEDFVGVGGLPTARFTVLDDDEPVLRLTSEDTLVATGEHIGRISFYSSDITTNGAGEKVYIEAVAENAGSQYSLAFATSDHTTSTGVEHMRLDEKGRLGINDDSPDGVLDVYNDVDATEEILVLQSHASQSGRIIQAVNGAGTTIYELGVTGIAQYGDARPVTVNGATGLIQIQASTGGWVMGYDILGSGGTALFALGAYGNADALTYGFIGPGTSGYATPWIAFTASEIAVNQSGLDQDLRVETDTTYNALVVDANEDDIDIAVETNIANDLNVTGDQTQYGGISVKGNAAATTISASSTYYQVTVFNTDDPENGADADNTSDDITIAVTGSYYVSVACSFSGGANTTYHVSAFKNNGATQLNNVHCSRKLARAAM